MPAKKVCTTRSPPGLDINEYLVRLNNILNQLTSSTERDIAVDRLNLMIETIRAAIQSNPGVKS
jgi:hypothetical protein